MNKILEKFGTIDGYDFTEIKESKASKQELFEEILMEDEQVLEEIREILKENNGLVFGIKKDKLIRGVYVFKNEIKDGKKCIKHYKTVFSKDVDQEVKEKYDKYLLELAKEVVSYNEYERIEFKDNVIQLDPKMTNKEKYIAMVGGFGIGFILGLLIFNEIYMGIIFGIIFAPTFSGIDVVVSKKRGRKSKNTNNKNENLS